MKQKYYAVRKGRTPGVYENWEACRQEIHGFSGAVYKSFPTRQEALAFVEGKEEDPAASGKPSAGEWNRLAEEMSLSLSPDEAIAFVDGSYDAARQAGGYGVVYLEEFGAETLLHGGFTAQDHPELIELRNVAAELLGVRSAVKKALADQKRKLTIFYDYAGIECWAKGTWKTNLPVTREYASFMKETFPVLSLVFQKVPAHTGVVYNEKADRLAKKAAEEAGA